MSFSAQATMFDLYLFGCLSILMHNMLLKKLFIDEYLYLNSIILWPLEWISTARGTLSIWTYLGFFNISFMLKLRITILGP